MVRRRVYPSYEPSNPNSGRILLWTSTVLTVAGALVYFKDEPQKMQELQGYMLGNLAIYRKTLGVLYDFIDPPSADELATRRIEDLRALLAPFTKTADGQYPVVRLVAKQKVSFFCLSLLL